MRLKRLAFLDKQSASGVPVNPHSEENSQLNLSSSEAAELNTGQSGR